MVNLARPALVLLCLAPALPALAQLPRDHLLKQAPTSLATGCTAPSQIPNQIFSSPYFWYVGSTITWTITLDLDRTTDVTGGVYSDIIDDNSIELLCSPGTYTLPAGATLTKCDPGFGPPSDGEIQISNITVPAATPVTFTFQTRILGSVPPQTEIKNASTFRSSATGTIQSRKGPGAPAGLATVVSTLRTDFLPTPVTTTKAVVDRNGGDVMPGDVLEYRIEIIWANCPDSPGTTIDLIDPLPLGMNFIGITECSSGGGEPYACNFDPGLRQLTMVNTQPQYVQNVPAVMTYEVQVDPAVPGGTKLCNQAVTNGGELSADPAKQTPDSPTCVTVITPTTATLEVYKDLLELDDDDGFLEQGERVRYEVWIRNVGRVNVLDAHVRDVLPAALSGFSVSSVQVLPASGSNQSQPAPAGLGAGIVEWDALRVPAHGAVKLSYDAVIASSASGLMCNQARVTSSAWSLSVQSDDPVSTAALDSTCRNVVPPQFRDATRRRPRSRTGTANGGPWTVGEGAVQPQGGAPQGQIAEP